MKIYPLKLRLISPLFNYGQVTNGGAITSDFIGDIALTYALNRVRKDAHFYQVYRDKPYYEELKTLDYLFTVARPIVTQRTGIYVRNTLFNVDGGPDHEILGKDGRFSVAKNLFKNYFKVQGIRPEGLYSVYLITRDNLQLDFPLTLRLGTGRECLAILNLITNKKELKQRPDIWLNAFTLKNIVGKEAIKRFIELKHFHIDYRLEQYVLLKKLNLEQTQSIFSTHF